jgi:hypothetical protein
MINIKTPDKMVEWFIGEKNPGREGLGVNDKPLPSPGVLNQPNNQ